MRTRPSRVLVALLSAALLAAGLTGCSGSSGASGPPTPADIRAMLAAHARAVLARNRGEFLAGVDDQPQAAAFRQTQASEFANLTRLPFARWAYTLGPRGHDPGAQRSARHRFGSSAVVYRVTLSYALRGVDPQPTAQQLSWTFVREAGRVVVADDSALASVGGASWQGPWDFGRLTVVRSAHALVLGHPQDGSLPAALARLVNAAVPVVTSVWGPQWSRDVLVLVPATAAERSADLGAVVPDQAPVAAVATSDGTDPVTGAALGQRLVVDPSRLRGLSSVGLRILLQHEVTHIADAAATTDSTPTWLAEGFAEYVGNLGSGQPTRFAAGELAAQVRRGKVPAALPSSAEFAGANAAIAYESAWLACRLIARRIGQAGLVRFYRAVGRSENRPGVAVDTTLHALLHEGPAQFVAQWRAYLRAELAFPR